MYETFLRMRTFKISIHKYVCEFFKRDGASFVKHLQMFSASKVTNVSERLRRRFAFFVFQHGEIPLLKVLRGISLVGRLVTVVQGLFLMQFTLDSTPRSNYRVENRKIVLKIMMYCNMHS